MAKMNENKSKISAGKIVIIVVIALCVILVAAFVWYVSDYYHADVDEYISSTDTVSVVETDNGLLFDGSGTDTALIFYPGAKVEYTSYAPIMMSLAENGVDCFLVEMPFNMAFFGMNRAMDIISEYDYDSFYISGHSLGGAMAASFASNHQDELTGVVFLAAYSTSSLGDLPTLSIYGSEDGVLNFEKVESGRQYATDYTEICIEGGNHAGFGCYGEQSGDNPATITQEEQWQETVETILEWMDAE
ncbi:MAG: alpha/beta hydrolase [Oscillospiraceae bacterium]|nr:alpha/beta hydrolase [Oscillospiraceae bacterium]